MIGTKFHKFLHRRIFIQLNSEVAQMSLRRSARVQSYTSASNAVNGSESVKVKTEKVVKKPSKGKKSKTSQDAMPPPDPPSTTETAATRTTKTTSEAPQTPRKRRRIQDPSSASPAKPPPITPTPSAIGFMTSTTPIRAPYSTGDIDDATPPPSPRPVEPHLTNAPLATPGGSHVVAYPTSASQMTASQQERLPAPTGTTATLLQEACAHLCNVDPRLTKLVEKHRCRIFAPEGLAEEVDPFRSLASGIMAQQVGPKVPRFRCLAFSLSMLKRRYLGGRGFERRGKVWWNATLIPRDAVTVRY